MLLLIDGYTVFVICFENFMKIGSKDINFIFNLMSNWNLYISSGLIRKLGIIL